GDRPGRGDDRSPVLVTRGAYLAWVEQFPFTAGWPPPAAAVAAAQFLPGGSAVLALEPLHDSFPHVGTQVLEGRAGHAGGEVLAPAPHHPVDLDEQRVQR